MYAFSELLYMAGIMESQYVTNTDLWSTDRTATYYFSAIMSQRRFHLLIRALRFDDSTTRKAVYKFDNLSPIRKIVDEFDALIITLLDSM